MSCVAVAISPVLAACHSPSVRHHRDDPAVFGDVRSSQLVSTCLDLLPSSPLLYATPKLSPFLSCVSSSSGSKCSPSQAPMPPPSPRVQCSPRTPSWTSPVTPIARSSSAMCLCGGMSFCSSCTSRPSSASSSDTKWRSPLERRFSGDAHFDGKLGSASTAPGVEPPSPRLSKSPLTRYPRSMPPPLSSFDAPAPSPRFPGTHSFFASPRTSSRPSSAKATVSRAPVVEECELAGSNACPPTVEGFWNSSADVSFLLDVRTDRGSTATTPEPVLEKNVVEEVPGPEVAGLNGRPSTPPLKRKRPPRLEIPAGANLVIPNNLFPVVDLSDAAPNELSVEGSYYGIACKKGRREVLEDTHRVVTDLNSDCGQAFFGVFDGHGGRQAADFAAENLVNKVMDAVESSKHGEDVEAAVRSGYLATDAEFLEQGVSSGASCVTAVMKDGFMVIANAGDCRAVLSRSGKAEALTNDHRAGREDERQRIESLGGIVDNLTGTWRVQGALAVSRGIGDLYLKEYVTAEPEVVKLRITPDCGFLILASDGLWDKVSNQEAVDTARELLQSERLNADVMDLQMPLAMASSSLSRKSELRTPTSGSWQSKLAVEQTHSGKCTELGITNESAGRVLSTGDNSGLDICVSKVDSHTSNTAIPEPPLSTAGRVAACKKLIEMSVKRGSHDDITVMIVDLHHFHRKPSTTQ